MGHFSDSSLSPQIQWGDPDACCNAIHPPLSLQDLLYARKCVTLGKQWSSALFFGVSVTKKMHISYPSQVSIGQCQNKCFIFKIKLQIVDWPITYTNVQSTSWYAIPVRWMVNIGKGEVLTNMGLCICGQNLVLNLLLQLVKNGSRPKGLSFLISLQDKLWGLSSNQFIKI